jgi:hypothetical protein
MTTVIDRNKIAFEACEKRMDLVCQKIVDLELEKRQIRREMFQLGGPALKGIYFLGHAIIEIIHAHHNGIRGADIIRILRNEGFSKSDTTKARDKLRRQVYNYIYIYHERGVIKKLDVGVYAPAVDILDHVIR